jgi:hypothetical protein
MENRTIYLVIETYISICSIENQVNNMLCMKVGDKHVTITNLRDGLFYSFSYESGRRCLILKKWWHYYPAILIEGVRKLLPEKMQKMLHLLK